MATVTLRRLGAAVLAASLLLPGPAPVLAASYPGDCDTGTHPSTNYIRFREKVAPIGTERIDAVKMTVTAHPLRPCVNGSTKDGWSAVWANAQNSDFVQLGYMEVAAGWNHNGVVGRKHVWVPNPKSDGIFEPVTWFESSGPHLNDVYRYEIINTAEPPPSGGRRWHFCIYNVTDGTSGCSVSGLTTQLSTTKAWWGYETWNSHDVLGARLSETYDVILNGLAYSWTTSSAWTWMTSSLCYALGTQPAYLCTSPTGSSMWGRTND